MSKFKAKIMSTKKPPYNLKSIEKINNFIVPEGYFEKFNDRLQNKMPSKREPSLLHPSNQLRWVIAASLIGFALITFAGLKYILNSNKVLVSQTTEIEAVISSQLNEYDDKQLYEIYSETAKENLSMDSPENDSIDDMVDYLLYTDLDVQSIANELF